MRKQTGDSLVLTFDPQAGRELALACLITSQIKGYPFEVALSAGYGATGVILADHLKSIDRTARRAERLGRCTDQVLQEVRATARIIG